MNYHVQNGEGGRGMVRFLNEDDVIGVFFLTKLVNVIPIGPTIPMLECTFR